MTDVRIAVDEPTPELLAVGVGTAGLTLDAVPTQVLPLAARSLVEAFVAENDPSAKPGSVASLPLPGELPNRVLVAGIGDGTADDLRLAGAAIGRAVRADADVNVTVAVPGLAGAEAAALAEGIVLGGYRFDARARPRPVVRADLVAVDDAAAVARGAEYGRGAVWARELTNTRTSTKTPSWVAAQAVAELTPLGVRVTTRDASWLAEHKFGGVLAVGGGSAAPPCLIEAAWRPRGASGRHIVLVGKGITFDTGGYNLKPGASMKTMYTDMAGGGAVLGALRVIAALRLPVRVTALVPLAENSVSGSAMRPDDVIRHYGGRTTEVRNTDAEGRLVLADALAYGAARLRPTALVDIATLTGGIKVALGEGTGGIFATSDELAAALVRSGERTGEPLWRMPMLDEYLPALDSTIADANNSAGQPQAMTAAMFLRPFAGDVPWAHLDIAGPARAGSDRGLTTAGATGFGARLLAGWVERVGAESVGIESVG
jgi:leucyl aminopeptidase